MKYGIEMEMKTVVRTGCRVCGGGNVCRTTRNRHIFIIRFNDASLQKKVMRDKWVELFRALKCMKNIRPQDVG
jgi:hypothetical protein